MTVVTRFPSPSFQVTLYKSHRNPTIQFDVRLSKQYTTTLKEYTFDFVVKKSALAVAVAVAQALALALELVLALSLALAPARALALSRLVLCVTHFQRPCVVRNEFQSFFCCVVRHSRVLYCARRNSSDPFVIRYSCVG